MLKSMVNALGPASSQDGEQCRFEFML